MGRYLELSADQIGTFTDIYSGNNHDVQGLNDRPLNYDSDYTQQGGKSVSPPRRGT